MKSTRSVYDVGNECVVVKNCGLLVMGGDLCSEGCGQCDQIGQFIGLWATF